MVSNILAQEWLTEPTHLILFLLKVKNKSVDEEYVNVTYRLKLFHRANFQ